MRLLQSWWTTLAHLGTQGLAGQDPQRRVTIGVNKMSLSVGLLTITVGTFCWLVTGRFMVLLGISLETVLLTIPLLLNRYRLYEGAGLAIYLIMSMATLFFGFIFGKAIESQLMVTYLIGVSLFMFKKTVYRAVCILSSLVILFFLEQDFAHPFLNPIQTTPGTAIVLKWSAYLAIIILIIITFHLYWRNNNALRKEIQENLAKEAQENKDKDRFITNATHEMRVSFYGIFSIIETLFKDAESPENVERLKRGINDLKTACKISQSIIDNILEFEKVKAGIPIVNRQNIFNPRVLFENTIDIYKYVAVENKVKIKLLFGKDLPTHIQTDDVKIRHILTNLLHNAIKFAPGHSTVIVKCLIRDTLLHFSVYDEGEGIKNDGTDIFAPFVTKNPDGLGIGLFIVREMVSILNGRIEVTSGEGGTTFAVSIPLEVIKQSVPVFHSHQN
jgi:signal transduction histidine kinase